MGGVGLLAALILQFSTSKYVAWVYWLTVVMVAIFGTMAAGVLHIGLGVPYLASTIFLALALALVFSVWYMLEKSLSIHSITSHRRELFYWATVMATFALGTAAGDMTAFSLHLGYLTSITLFGFMIMIIGLSWRLFNPNAIVVFWIIYILTRPLGASIADWTAKSRSVSGLGLGDGPVSLVLVILIIAFVIYMTFNNRIKSEESLSTLR